MPLKPTCPICNSRKWNLDSLGGQVCENGHQRRGYQILESEEFSKGRKKRNIQPKKAKANIKTQRPLYVTHKETQKLFMVSTQFVLRKLIHILIHEMGFPPQFERAPVESDNEFGDATTKEKSIEEKFRMSNILYEFKLSYLLCILHLGCIWMRFPVLMNDIHRWANSGRLPFKEVHREIPESIKAILRGKFLSKLFHVKRLNSVYRLSLMEHTFVKFYNKYYGIVFPEINSSPVLYRFIRDLMLPIETYSVAKELLQLINLKLDWSQAAQYHPDNLLLGIVIVVTKLIYGLDHNKSDSDEIIQYFPTFEDWIKKLSDRHDKLFQQEIPWDFVDIKEWMEKNPDKYIEYCAGLLLSNVNQESKESKESSTINKRKDGDKKIQLSKPFQQFSKTVAIEIENKTLENEINDLKESLKLYKSQLKNSKAELTIQEFYKIIKKINNFQKKIESLKNKEFYVEPIEDEIRELNFCIKNNSIGDEEYQQESHQKSYNIQDRYSTFLYKKDDDERSPKLNIGEKYTSYQLNRLRFRSKRDDWFQKQVELIGAYHEDYERVLILFSSLTGESINKVQAAVIKIEYDLYKAIENESL
ncbi:5643_t:CDS:2 [Diversispora eburnea]|uniref:5643_t:CDS:1 n=1 Tax=Diversispora eburnea TaxID=1213867 RepID=A0A9N8W5M8_9GLOM|nr:5643_t:CDS:2 [Diversispora eburnea]